MSSLRSWARALSCVLAVTAVSPSVADAEERRSHRTHRRRVGAIARNAPPVERTLDDRRHMVVSSFMRGEGIRSCWMRQIYRDPSTTTRRITVALFVDRAGRIVSVDVRDPMAPALARCIAATSAAVAPVGPGEAFEAQGTLTLERGE